MKPRRVDLLRAIVEEGLDVEHGDLMSLFGVYPLDHGYPFGDGHDGEIVYAVTTGTAHGVAIVPTGDGMTLETLNRRADGNGDWAPSDLQAAVELAETIVENVIWGTRERVRRRLLEIADLHWFGSERNHDQIISDIVAALPE